MGDLQLPGLQWPANLAPAQMGHGVPPLPPVPGQAHLQRPLLEPEKDGAGQGLPGSQGVQALPPDVAQILAQGAEAIEGLTPPTSTLFAKEVADILHTMKTNKGHGAANTGSVGSQPEPSLEGVLSDQVPSVSSAAASSAESNGAQAATASTDQRDADSQGPAGQLAKLQGPQGNPLPSRRAGPAARSQSRRSMRELGLGIVEEEGKVQVIPSVYHCQV